MLCPILKQWGTRLKPATLTADICDSKHLHSACCTVWQCFQCRNTFVIFCHTWYWQRFQHTAPVCCMLRVSSIFQNTATPQTFLYQVHPQYLRFKNMFWLLHVDTEAFPSHDSSMWFALLTPWTCCVLVVHVCCPFLKECDWQHARLF